MSDKTDDFAFELIPHSAIRKAIAARVSQSCREIPQFDLHTELDATALVDTRNFYKTETAETEHKPGYNDFLLHVCSRTLLKHRALNAHYSENGIRLFQDANIGFAVASDKGVLMPVIHKAQKKDLMQISCENGRLVALAQKARLRAGAQMHGTFSISSLGGYGIASFNAVISPPQVAILAAGAIDRRPWIDEGTVVVRPTLRLTLTVDHRVVDGAQAASFLMDLKTMLENYSPHIK